MSDIENAGIDDLVIVGHSLAGLTVPGVVTKLGPAQVREMILAAAFLPPDGAAFVDTMPRALGWYARRTAKRNVQKGIPNTLPTAWATFAFCNGMTRASAVAQPARIDKMSTTLTMRIRRLPRAHGVDHDETTRRVDRG